MLKWRKGFFVALAVALAALNALVAYCPDQDELNGMRADLCAVLLQTVRALLNHFKEVMLLSVKPMT